MLSEVKKLDIERQASIGAERISDESLRKEAATAHTSRRDESLSSDERAEFEILDRVYTREMVQRGLTV
jgi:hypothetical protein